jgi:hypothetical protein
MLQSGESASKAPQASFQRLPAPLFYIVANYLDGISLCHAVHAAGPSWRNDAFLRTKLLHAHLRCLEVWLVPYALYAHFLYSTHKHFVFARFMPAIRSDLSDSAMGSGTRTSAGTK